MFRDEIKDILEGLYGSLGRSTDGLNARIDAAMVDWEGVPAARMREAALEWRRSFSKLPTNAELRTAAGYGANRPVGGDGEYPPWKVNRNRVVEIARRELMADKITREDYREIYEASLTERGAATVCERYREELMRGEPRPNTDDGARPTREQHQAAIRLISGLSRGHYGPEAANFVPKVMDGSIAPSEVITLCDRADAKRETA